MNGQNLQLRMPFQDAVENQIVQGDAGFQRIADHIVEVEPGQAAGVGEAVGMDDDERAELLGLLPKRGKGRMRKLLTVDVGEDLHTLEAELADATLELLCRFVAI